MRDEENAEEIIEPPKEEAEAELDEKTSLKDICNEQNQLQLDVEAFFKIGVEVYGKGRDYSGTY